RDPDAVKRLFDRASAAIPTDEAGRTGVTIYDATAAPIAWAGRVFDLTRNQLEGPSTLFIAGSTLGPRLVRINPITDEDGAPGARLATIVVEQTLGTLPESPGIADTFVLSTLIAPVTVQVPVGA